MDKCRHHLDRNACVVCQKMEVAYCQEARQLPAHRPLLYCSAKLRHLGTLLQGGPEAGMKEEEKG
jgi:hypothetical protein